MRSPVAVLVFSCQYIKAFVVFHEAHHSLTDNKTVSPLRGSHHDSTFLKLKLLYLSWIQQIIRFNKLETEEKFLFDFSLRKGFFGMKKYMISFFLFGLGICFNYFNCLNRKGFTSVFYLLLIIKSWNLVSSFPYTPRTDFIRSTVFFGDPVNTFLYVPKRIYHVNKSYNLWLPIKNKLECVEQSWAAIVGF